MEAELVNLRAAMVSTGDLLDGSAALHLDAADAEAPDVPQTVADAPLDARG